MKFLSKLNLYLILILPPSLVISTFLSDFIICLSALIFIIITTKEEKLFFLSNKFFIIYFVWIIYLIFISTISEYPYLSYESSLFYFRFGFFVLSIFYISNKFIEFNKLFFYSLLFTFLFLIFDTYLQYYTGKNILGYTSDGMRYSGMFGDEKKLGSFISRIFPLLVGLYIIIYKNFKKNIFLISIFFILIEILIIITGERSALFNLVLFNIFMILFFKKFIIFRILTLFLSSIILFFLVTNNPLIKERLIDETIKQVTNKNTNLENINLDEIKFNDLKFFSIEHQVFAITGFNIFMDNKFLGIGPKNYREVCKKEAYNFEKNGYSGCSTHPHNFYIQLLAETGLIGTIPVFLIFFSAIFYLLKILIKGNLENNYIMQSLSCFIFCIFISFWPIIPSGNFFNNWISIIIYLPFPFILSIFKNLKLKS